MYNNGFDIYQITKLSGSSIGALLCICIIFEYTFAEMKEMMINIINRKLFDFNEYPDNRQYLCNILDKYSLTDGVEMDELLKIIFIKKNYNYKTLTFRELYQKYKKLVIINVSNITKCQAEYLSMRHTPDFNIYESLRMTTRVPLLLPYITNNNNIYVDGDLYSPFPIYGFSSNEIKSAKKGNMIGLMSLKQTNLELNTVTNYISVLLNGCINNYYTQSIKSFKKYNIINNVPNNINSFSIHSSDINQIYDLGKISADLFINQIK